jgi:CheY-specific phosphatase CheX
MSSELCRALDTAVSETLELMCFTGLLGKCASRPSGDVMCASVRFHGDADGMVRLSVPENTALDLTASFLGLDTQEVSADHVHSVAVELTNMICGAMLSYHAGNARFHLDQPVVPAANVNGRESLSCGYDIGTGAIWLDVWFEQVH